MNSPDSRSRESSPFRVLVVASMYPTPEHPAFGTFVKRQVDSLVLAGCPHEVLLIEGWRSRFNYLRGIWNVRNAVRKGRFDIIHAYYGLCGFLAACQTRVPVVVSFCGSDLNPGFAGKTRAPLRSRLVIALGQIAAWRAKACIVRSREMMSRLFSRSVRTRTHIVTSGVDLSLFRPLDRCEARRRLGWDLHQPTMLFVCADAGLPAVKRPELASAVAEQVRKVLPEANLKVLAGRAQEELPDFYNAADVLLVTSASEGSPNVVKEALACNLPVVSTRVGDVPEILGGLKNCHVGSDEPSELSSRVLQVLTSGERTDSRERMEVYSLEQTAAAILRIYRDVCSAVEVPGDLTSSMEGTLH